MSRAKQESEELSQINDQRAFEYARAVIRHSVALNIRGIIPLPVISEIRQSDIQHGNIAPITSTTA